ncbi:MAG: HD domain-containing protein, partial [Bacteroidales bacterium]|nr:HD domain-containing protein [Bacteroidales bacterium]
RILTAARFACNFAGFEIENNLRQTMKDLGHTIDQTYLHSDDTEKRRVAYERIQKEIIGGLTNNAAKYLEILDQAELLRVILPEIEKLKNVQQPKDYHSEGDVFTHTMLVLKNIPATASIELKLAGLFHDVGKSTTFHSDENGKITFYGHEKESANIAKSALKRLKFSNKIIDEVAWLVGDHMRINSFKLMNQSKQKTMVSNSSFGDLLVLARADSRSSIRPDGSVEDETFYDDVAQIASDLIEKANGPVFVEIIDGKDVIDEFRKLGIDDPMKTHGKHIGRIKKHINEAFNDGYIESRDEALSLIEKMIKQSS